MVRQAHAYLVSAISGATVIAIAIVAFVVLISAQVFKDWPIAALGGGDDKAAVSEASAVSTQGGPAVGAPKTVNPGAAASAPTGAGGGNPASGGGNRVAAPQENSGVGSGAPPVTASEPVASAPGSGGNPGSTGSTPVNSSNPSPSPSASSPSTPASSGGGGTATSTSSGKGSGGGSKPGGGSVVEEVVAPITGGGGSTAAKVTETVNETVNSVDETVTGGALQGSGVTGVTEEVVDGVAGPESLVGKTVDEVGNTVGGLLGGQR